MTSSKRNPSTVPGVDPALVQILGRARARKLRKFAEQTGLSHEFLLKFGMELVECAVHNLRAKNIEAVQMGIARWGNLPATQRQELARSAVNARWAKYRATKAAAESGSAETQEAGTGRKKPADKN